MVHQLLSCRQMTVLENIVLGTQPLWSFNSGKTRARARITDAGGGLWSRVDPDRMSQRNFRVGERPAWSKFSRRYYREARILILDETDGSADADGDQKPVGLPR